jgi:hypothetical protein
MSGDSFIGARPCTRTAHALTVCVCSLDVCTQIYFRFYSDLKHIIEIRNAYMPTVGALLSSKRPHTWWWYIFCADLPIRPHSTPRLAHICLLKSVKTWRRRSYQTHITLAFVLYRIVLRLRCWCPVHTRKRTRGRRRMCVRARMLTSVHRSCCIFARRHCPSAPCRPATVQCTYNQLLSGYKTVLTLCLNHSTAKCAHKNSESKWILICALGQMLYFGYKWWTNGGVHVRDTLSRNRPVNIYTKYSLGFWCWWGVRWWHLFRPALVFLHALYASIEHGESASRFPSTGTRVLCVLPILLCVRPLNAIAYLWINPWAQNTCIST